MKPWDYTNCKDIGNIGTYTCPSNGVVVIENYAEASNKSFSIDGRTIYNWNNGSSNGNIYPVKEGTIITSNQGSSYGNNLVFYPYLE